MKSWLKTTNKASYLGRAFAGWLDSRAEALGMSKAEELAYMRELLAGMEESHAARLALEARYAGLQSEIRSETKSKVKSLYDELQRISGEFHAAQEKRAQELLRSFDMMRGLNLSQTNADRNAEEVGRLRDAYDRAAESLRSVQRELREAERGSDAHARIAERERQALAARSEAQRALAEAVAEASRSQTDIMAGNLREQLDNLSEWARQVDRLAERGVYDGFVEHMRAMGPQAVRYLQQLNESTDEELTELAKLYREKHRLARRYAARELEGLYRETARKADDLRRELERIGREKYPAVGKALIQGIETGIHNRQSSLINAAVNSAMAAFRAARAALGIHSPSKKGEYLGRMFSEGLALGIDKGAASVRKSVCEIAEYVKSLGDRPLLPSAGSAAREIGRRLSASAQAGPRPAFAGAGGGGFPQGDTIVNIHQPVKSPAETGRALRNALEDLGRDYY